MILAVAIALGVTGATPLAASASPHDPPVSTAGLTVPAYDPHAFQAGINLLVYGQHPGYGNLTALMAKWHKWGVKDVAIAFPLYQSGNYAVNIGPGHLTPRLSALYKLIMRLENGGFDVMMRPLLDEANIRPSWRGAIQPWSVADWFRNYARALVPEARLAGHMGVAQFDIGTELSSLQGYTAQWINLIAQIRKVYSGTLVYSVNWNDAVREPWFSQLDAVGVDAYFPVHLPYGANTASIAAVLRRDAANLPNFGKPVWITEAGLVPVEGAYHVPYSLVWPGMKFDPTAQAQYYQAVCSAFTPSVQGLYWWSSDLGTGKGSTSSYTPTAAAASAMTACFANITASR